MTAVEQLVEEVEVISNSIGISRIEKIELYNKAIEKAKEMEKHEKIKFALNVCIERAQTHGGDALEIAKKLANL